MKRKDTKFNMKGLANGPLKICPVCGFSFKTFDPATGKKAKVCPMCGFKLIEPNLFPEKPSDFDKRILF